MSADNPLLEGFTDIKKAQAITPELKNPLLEGYEDVHAAPEAGYRRSVQATSGISAEQMREGLNAQAEMDAPLDWIQNNQSQVTKFREAQGILHTLDNSNAPILKKRAEDFKFLGLAKDDLHTLASLNTMSSFASTGIKGLTEAFGQKVVESAQTQDQANRSQLQELMLRRAARDAFQGPGEGGVEMNSARSYNNFQRDLDAMGGLPFMSPENQEEIYKKTYETLRSDEFAYARYLDDKSREQEVENMAANAPDNAYLRNIGASFAEGGLSTAALFARGVDYITGTDYTDGILDAKGVVTEGVNLRNDRDLSEGASWFANIFRSSSQSLQSVATPGGYAAIISRQVLTQANESYSEAQDQGLSGGDAMRYAVKKAAPTAILGVAFGVGPLAKIFGPGAEGVFANSFMQGLKTTMTREGAKGLAKSGALSLTGELIEEVSTTLAEYAVDRQTFGDEYAGDLGTQIQDTIASTILTMGLGPTTQVTASGIGKAMGSMLGRTVKQSTEATKSVVTETHFGEIEAEVLQSKLRERSPEDFESYIDETLDTSPVKDIYLPADKLDEYFQTVNDPEAKQAMLDALDIQVDFQNAVDLGTDIKIASSKWLTKVSGTDAGEAMKAFMKFSPDVEAMSPADRAEFVKDKELILQTARDEALKEIQENGVPEFAQTYRDAILNDNKLGVDAEGADMEMAAFLAQVDSVRKQTGETREEFVARKNYVVEIDGVQVPLVPTDAQVSNQILQERNFALADTENAQTPSGVSYAETYRDPIEGSTWAELDDTRRQEIINADYARSLPAVEDADGEEFAQGPIDYSNLFSWFGDVEIVNSPEKHDFKTGEAVGMSLFHETTTDSLEGIRKDGTFDLSKGKARLTDEQMPDGIFFKPTAGEIGVAREDTEQFQVETKMRNPLVMPDRIEFGKFLNKDDEYYAKAKALEDNDTLRKAESDAFFERYKGLERRSEELAKARAEHQVVLDAWGDEGRDLATSARARATEYLKEQGYDGLIVKEDEGSFGRATQTFVVFDNNQIKSAYENTGAFDPQDPNIFNQSAAFHGSPHNILANQDPEQRKFMLDNIGTGEGAQAFGWGLYFTSEKGVAEFYAESLVGDEVLINGVNAFDPVDSPIRLLQAGHQTSTLRKWIVQGRGDHDSIVKNLEAQRAESLDTFGKEQEENVNRRFDETLDYFDSVKEAGLTFETEKGNIFKVNLWEGKEENLLEWDKGVPQKQIESALDLAAEENNPAFFEELEIASNSPEWLRMSGEKLYQNLVSATSSVDAQGNHQFSETRQKEVSLFLNRAGFDGISFPAQSGGRGDGSKGTNYVVFDDSAVNIVEHELFQDAQGQQGAKGSIVFPKRTGDATIVKLLQNRDVSTLGHELAHDYFQDMKSIIASGQGDEQFLADYQTIRQWSSEQGSQLLKDIKKSGNTQALDFINANGGAKFISQVAKGEVEGGVATEAIDRSIHELFARGSELFRREGKAPSTKLAAAFRRFQEWLTTIYKSAAELGVEMSDEMRGAYGRMYASNEEINQATEYYEGKTDILDTINADREEREAAKARRNAAEDDSKDKNWERFRKAWFKTLGGKKGIQAKATDEVKESRVYTAMYDAIEGVGLNLGEVTEAFGKQTAEDMKTKNSKILKKNGAPISDFVIRYEYESAKEFIDDLHGAPKRNEMIKIRTEDLMREEEQKARQAQDALDAHEGSEAYHSDLRLEALAVEYEALQDRSAINRGQEPARSGARAIVRTEVLPEVKYPKGGIAEVHQQVIESGDRAVLTKHKERIDNELAKLDEEFDRPIVRSRNALKNSFTAAEQGYDVSEEGAIRLIRRALPNVFKKGEIQSKSRRESLGLYDSMLDTAHDVLVNNEFEQLADNAQDLLDRALEIPTKQAADENRNEAIKATVRDQYQGEIDLAQEELGFMFTEADQALASLPEEVSRVAPEFHSSETAKIFREAAQEAISELPVREATQYHLYANREARASRKAFRLAQKGDIEGAEVEKRLQLINHAMVTASVKAREERSKTEKSIKRLSKGKNVEPGYKAASGALAYQYGLSSKAPAKDVNPLSYIADENAVLPSGLTLPDWMVDNSEAVDYRDLTMKRFRELHDAFKQLDARGSNLAKSNIAAKGATIDEAVERMVVPMQERTKDFRLLKRGGLLTKQRKWLDGVVADWTMLQFSFDAADNYTNLGPKGFIGPNGQMPAALSDAIGARKKIWSDEIEPKIKKVADVLVPASKEWDAKFGKTREIPGLPYNENEDGIIVKDWTFEQWFMAYLNTGNEGNLRTIKEGFGYDDDQVRLLREQASPELVKAAQDIWDIIDDRYEPLNKVYTRVNGVGMTKVLPAPFVTRATNGEYIESKGGYFPIRGNHKLDKKHAERYEKAVFEDRQNSLYRSPKVQDSSTISRTDPGSKTPPLLSFNVLFDHLSDTAHYETHLEIVNDIDKVIQHPTWEKNFTDKEGVEVYKRLRPWLQDIARPPSAYLTGGEAAFETMRNMSTVAILGANMSVILKQPHSVWNAVVEVGAAPVLDGYATFIKDPNGVIEKVNNLDPNMKQRSKGVERDIKATFKKFNPFTVKGQKLEKVRDASMAGISFADSITAYPIWIGTFNKALTDNGGDVKKAVQRASDVIRRTQPSSDIMDQNAMQRNKGSIERMYTMFSTYMFRYGNYSRQYRKAYKDGAISRRQYYRQVALAQFAAPMGMSLMMSLIRNGDLPDWDEMLVDVLAYWAGPIPIIANMVGAFRYGSELGDSPAFEGLDRAGNALRGVGKVIQDPGDKNAQLKAAEGLALVGEFATGIKALTVGKQLYKGAEDLIEGETKNPARLFIKPTKKKGAR